MENSNTHIDTLHDAVLHLNESSLSLVDFDQIKTCLEQTTSQLQSHTQIETDLAMLRQDYQLRIGGMVKAMAAITRNRHHWRDALSFVEKLPELDATALLHEYRRVAARFRDTFPLTTHVNCK